MTNKEMIKLYYNMWNSKDFDKADDICDQDLRFRGSLGIVANGIEGFKDYAQMFTIAFPNMYHAVEMSVCENNIIAAYVTYTGTHEGEIFGHVPTGKHIHFSGASFFQIKNGKIASINILGDLSSLHKQLSE